MSRIDFIAYPPTSFPFRDLLVLEQLALAPQDTVCEIGVGSGATTARLAKICERVTGFEISIATVSALRYLEERHPNLRFVVADVTEGPALRPFEAQFTRLIACDTLEHVSDPGAFFRAVAKLLKPGGEFLVTFPNEPVDRLHGITRFDDVASLSRLLDLAGLPDHKIGAARLAGPSEAVAEVFGWKPIELVRTILRRKKGAGGKKAGESSAGADAPQTFDETHFFKRMNTWRRVSPLVNAYWYGVLKLMDARGPCFEIDYDFRSEPFANCQVVILGRKPQG